MASYAYDALILATGASHSYFGHDDWELLAPGLKTLEDALEIRRRVLLAYEAAERCLDGAERRALLTFVVIGGGPTGVELSGALAEIARQSMARDFRVIDPSQARIVLLEGGPRVPCPPSLRRSRRRRGGALAQRCRGAHRCDGHRRSPPTPCGSAAIRSAAVPCSGQRGSKRRRWPRSLGVPLDRAGRVPVEPDLSVPGHPDVFVIGDLGTFIPSDRSARCPAWRR